MPTNLRIISIVFALLIILVTLFIVRKGKISVKYSLIWFLSALILLLFTLFPSILEWLTGIIGIQVASNMIFALIIGILILVTMSLTIIVSGQNDKIRLLIQEVSLLKDKKNEK